MSALFWPEWKPGVSTNMIWFLFSVLIPKNLCLVVWGFLEVIAIFWPRILFKRVDFPAFVLPTMET